MIKQNTIDDVLHRALIEDVVAQFVELTKSGASYKGKSPWTNEKTPSFHVVPAKGIFKDFSSGKGGNVVTFLMEKEGFTYPQAIEWLCDFYNIPCEREEKQQSEEQLTKNDQADKLLRSCAGQYQQQRDHDMFIAFCTERGLTDDDIHKWGLGYAPNQFQFLTQKIIDAGLWGVAEELGVCKTTNGKNFDVLRGRVIFPIHDNRSRLVGFAGRLSEWDEGRSKPPKYMNPKDSWFYPKSSILYGFQFARTHIARERTVYITEGYTDVIAMHAMGMENTVALCGTALSEQHTKSIRAIADRAVLVLDADEAGKRAAEKSLHRTLPVGFITEVCVLPEGSDPDDLRRTGIDPEAFQKQIKSCQVDALDWLLNRWIGERELSPAEKGQISKDFAAVVALIEDPVVRSEYVKLAARRIKVEAKDIRKVIDDKASRRIEARPDSKDEVTMAKKAGATSAEWDMLMERGFCERGDGYYFMRDSAKDNTLMRGTNFTIEPLFHVLSDNADDNKRMIKILHPRRTQIVDMPSAAMVSWMDFKKELSRRGPFQFMPGSSVHHFNVVMCHIAESFPECVEVVTLGQQPEGFYAFANGIVDGGAFIPVDDYGICSYAYEREGINGEMESVTDRFYFPAFSSIYRYVRPDGDDKYQNDRHFVFKKASVGFSGWMDGMYGAYEHYAIPGIAYVIACTFRDIYFKKKGSFPLVFCYGEKGCGKSSFMESVEAFFTFNQQLLNLNAATHVGFHSRLARLSNAVVCVDEYNDEDIDPVFFQGLKQAYDGTGREKGRKSGRNRTEVTSIRSGMVVGGQYLPSRDDHSLTSRSVVLEFSVDNQRTARTEDAFERLTDIQKKGLSSLVVELLGHRKVMEKHWMDVFAEFSDLLKKKLGAFEYTPRVLNNYAALGSAVAVLMSKVPAAFTFPFSPEDLMKFCVDGVKTVSRIMNTGEAAAEFWNIFTQLIDRNMGQNFNAGGIRHGFEYKILENQPAITLRRDGRNYSWDNVKGEGLLLVRMSAVHAAYMKEHRTQFGKVGMQKVTIENFLRARGYYVGTCPRTEFEGIAGTSAMVFRLDMLEDLGYSIRRTSQSEGPPPAAWGSTEIPKAEGTEKKIKELPF